MALSHPVFLYHDSWKSHSISEMKTNTTPKNILTNHYEYGKVKAANERNHHDSTSRFDSCRNERLAGEE